MKTKENTFRRNSKWILLFMTTIIFLEWIVPLSEGRVVFEGERVKLTDDFGLRRVRLGEISEINIENWAKRDIIVHSVSLINKEDSKSCTIISSELNKKIEHIESFQIDFKDCVSRTDYTELIIQIDYSIFEDDDTIQNKTISELLIVDYRESINLLGFLFILIILVIPFVINRYFKKKYDHEKLLSIYSKLYMGSLFIFVIVFLLWQTGIILFFQEILFGKIIINHVIMMAFFVIFLFLSIGLIPLMKEKYSRLKFLLITLALLIILSIFIIEVATPLFILIITGW